MGEGASSRLDILGQVLESGSGLGLEAGVGPWRTDMLQVPRYLSHTCFRAEWRKWTLLDLIVAGLGAL